MFYAKFNSVQLSTGKYIIFDILVCTYESKALNRGWHLFKNLISTTKETLFFLNDTQKINQSTGNETQNP